MKNLVGNLHDNDLRLLRVFQSIVRNGGFSASQEALGLTPATISNHMSALESRLGVRLCHRGRGGFRLTEQGKQVHSAMLDLFGSIETFRSAVGSTKGEITGTIEFGAVDALYTNRDFPLDKAIGKFALSAPKATLNVHVASPQELLQGLIAGRFHIILTPTRSLPKSIESFLVFQELQQLYCGERHPLFDTSDASITSQMLTKYPFVGRSYEENEPICGIKFNWQSVTSHMESAMLMILSGQYIGFLPDHFASHRVHSNELRPINKQDVNFYDDFRIALRRKHPNAAAKHLARVIKEIPSTILPHEIP